MDNQLQDIFDIDQIIPPLSPVTPGTQAFIDSFDLSAFNSKISNQDNYYQDADQRVQDFSMTDILNAEKSTGLFGCNKISEEQTFTGALNDLEIFGLENDPTEMQDFDFDDFTLNTDNIMAGYTTIDDSQIDPALHMLDSSAGVTPSNLFYIPKRLKSSRKNTEIYQPIDLSPPTADFEKNIAHQLSEFNQLTPARPGTQYIENPSAPTNPDNFFQSTVEVPRIRIDGSYAIEHNKSGSIYQYTTYTPLPTWYAPDFPASGISYNNLGFLHKDIQFTPANLTSFIRNHPLGPRLVLRIEKHPYEVKGRFAPSRSNKGKQKYANCRNANCALGTVLKVGDLRVAIDEVTGRFQENDVQDNDPYFSSGFIHLQCFESLTNVAPLMHMGILIPDTREDFTKEPVCRNGTKNNNKMAFSPKELTAFNDWLRSSSPSQAQIHGRESLTAKVWLANCKRSRLKCIRRAPPGVTQEDIDAHSQSHALWGGRRAVGKSVAEMNRLEEEGRCNELIAPRNATSGKLGMGPTGATALRFSKRKDPFGESKRGRPSKRGRRAMPRSSPDPNLRKTVLRSPPQKGHKPPGNILVYSTSKRKALSPVSVFSPSLGNWSLLDTPSVNNSFFTAPLGPKSSQPATPTRRSPRLRKKVKYTDFDSEAENDLGVKENDKENADWSTGFDELFEEFLC